MLKTIIEEKKVLHFGVNSVVLLEHACVLCVTPGLHLLSFAENRRERILAANIDEKPLIWFTLESIRQENVKKM